MYKLCTAGAIHVRGLVEGREAVLLLSGHYFTGTPPVLCCGSADDTVRLLVVCSSVHTSGKRQQNSELEDNRHRFGYHRIQ